MLKKNIHLNEALAWFPRLTVVTKSDFGKIYSSDEIKKDFIENLSFVKALKKNPKALEGIKKLVDSGTIVPAQKTKNIVSYFFARWPIVRDHNYIMGSHAVINDKARIIIYLDSHYLSYGLYNPEKVYKTVIHELAHNYVYNEPNSFLGVYKKHLMNFYKALFEDYFKITPGKADKAIEDFIKNLLMLEKSAYSDEARAKKYWSYIEKLSKMSNFTPEKRQMRLEIYQNTIRMYQQGVGVYLQYYYENPVVTSLYTAYDIAFKYNKMNSILAQELFCLSEVFAIMTEYGHDKYILDYLKTI